MPLEVIVGDKKVLDEKIEYNKCEIQERTLAHYFSFLFCEIVQLAVF
jgi:hypothetical protein